MDRVKYLQEKLAKSATSVNESWENGRELATRGIGIYTKAEAAKHRNEGNHIDFYEPENGNKVGGVITHTGQEHYRIKEHHSGKIHTFKYKDALREADEYEGSEEDREEDTKGEKETGMSHAEYEKSDRDKKEDEAGEKRMEAKESLEQSIVSVIREAARGRKPKPGSEAWHRQQAAGGTFEEAPSIHAQLLNHKDLGKGKIKFKDNTEAEVTPHQREKALHKINSLVGPGTNPDHREHVMKELAASHAHFLHHIGEGPKPETTKPSRDTYHNMYAIAAEETNVRDVAMDIEDHLDNCCQDPGHIKKEVPGATDHMIRSMKKARQYDLHYNKEQNEYKSLETVISEMIQPK